MLIRFIKPWQNFAPPVEAELSDPVAAILVKREIAEVLAPVTEKVTRKPKKEKTNGPHP